MVLLYLLYTLNGCTFVMKREITWRQRFSSLDYLDALTEVQKVGYGISVFLKVFYQTISCLMFHQNKKSYFVFDRCIQAWILVVNYGSESHSINFYKTDIWKRCRNLDKRRKRSAGSRGNISLRDSKYQAS